MSDKLSRSKKRQYEDNLTQKMTKEDFKENHIPVLNNTLQEYKP